MDKDINYCPNAPDGRHKFYLFKTFVDYAPIYDDKITPGPVYEKIEYALSGCNCGAAIKQRITDGGEL